MAWKMRILELSLSMTNSPDRISVTRSVRSLDKNHRLKDPLYVFTAQLLSILISILYACDFPFSMVMIVFVVMSSPHECDHPAFHVADIYIVGL